MTFACACRESPCPHTRAEHRRLLGPVLAAIPAAAVGMRRGADRRRPAIFIVDWDDTCCATSFLERCGVMADLDSRMDERVAECLRVLENRVLSLLKTAVGLGTVLIVTNAGDGWVELSSKRFLPAVRAFLDQNYKLVRVISARARYVDAYREQPLQWKVLTFADELRALYAKVAYPGQPLHVIVLGDSVGDQYAAHAACESLAAAGMPITLKVVKFLERPSIDQLCKELAVLLDHIIAMTAHPEAFDVSMYKEQTPPVPENVPAQPYPQQSMHRIPQQQSQQSASTGPVPMETDEPQQSQKQRTMPTISSMCAAAV